MLSSCILWKQEEQWVKGLNSLVERTGSISAEEDAGLARAMVGLVEGGQQNKKLEYAYLLARDLDKSGTNPQRSLNLRESEFSRVIREFGLTKEEERLLREKVARGGGHGDDYVPDFPSPLYRGSYHGTFRPYPDVYASSKGVLARRAEIGNLGSLTVTDLEGGRRGVEMELSSLNDGPNNDLWGRISSARLEVEEGHNIVASLGISHVIRDYLLERLRTGEIDYNKLMTIAKSVSIVNPFGEQIAQMLGAANDRDKLEGEISEIRRESKSLLTGVIERYIGEPRVVAEEKHKDLWG